MNHPDLAWQLTMLRAITRDTGRSTAVEQDKLVRDWERAGQRIERKAAA